MPIARIAKILACLVTIASCTRGKAVDPPADQPPPAIVNPLSAPRGLVADLPFSNDFNEVVLNASVSHGKPTDTDRPKFRLLLDSGAASAAFNVGSVTDHKVSLGAPEHTSYQILSGLGNSVQHLRIDVYSHVNINFDGLDLDEGVTVFDEVTPFPELDGLLGAEIFGAFIVEIDYPGRRVRLFDPGAFAPPVAADHFVAVPMTVSDREAAIDVVVKPNGFPATRVHLRVDTGNAGGILFTNTFVKRHPWQSHLSASVPIRGVGIGGNVLGREGRLRSVTLGHVTMANPLASFSENRQGMAGDSKYDGYIGNDILSRFDAIIDYKHRMLYLKPGPDADRAFPTTRYFGSAGISKRLADGGCAIPSVAPGSPLARAGVRAGDVLYAVDGVSIAQTSTSDLLQQLSQAGDMTIFTIYRPKDQKRRDITVHSVRY